MNDKHNPWTGAFDFGVERADTAAEKAFLRDAERIATEVAAMSDEDVADYLVEHGLQDLVEDERVEAVLASALVEAERRRTDAGPSFAVRDGRPVKEAGRKAVNGGNVVRGAFPARHDKVP